MLLNLEHFNCIECSYEFIVVTPPKQCAINYCPYCGKILRKLIENEGNENNE